METETYTLPAYWASALVNGDFSGLDCENEQILIRRWLELQPQLGSCLTCSDEPSFRWSHDAPDVQACDCLDFTFCLLTNK